MGDRYRKFKKRENQALAAICVGVSTNLEIYVRSSETTQDARANLEKHFTKTVSKKSFYPVKLYSTRIKKGQNIIEHINHIKKIEWLIE